jgi:predicted nucleotidyltransferase
MCSGSYSVIADHTHLLIRNGDVVTVRGFPAAGTIIAVPIYFRRSAGGRQLRAASFEKCVDEFAVRYSAEYPELVAESAFGRQVHVKAPDIIEIFDPFGSLDRAYGKLSAISRKCIDVLSRHVHRSDIGIIGSRLIGFARADADLDVVIRGECHLSFVRSAMARIVAELGAVVAIERGQYTRSIRKYESLFNSHYNSFDRMIANRWPTICIPGAFFAKLRFTYDPAVDYVPQVPCPTHYSTASIRGVVVEGRGVAHMPRRFTVADARSRDWEVLTYFWDYSYCVSEDDIVTVRGWCDESARLLVIGDRREHGVIIHCLARPSCYVLPE